MFEMVLAFITAHWTSISAIGVAVPALGLALRQKAYMLFFTLALDLVKKVAVQELSGEEKRKKVAEQTYDLLPIWAQKLLSKKNLEDIVEKAYQQLKSEGQI